MGNIGDLGDRGKIEKSRKSKERERRKEGRCTGRGGQVIGKREGGREEGDGKRKEEHELVHYFS